MTARGRAGIVLDNLLVYVTGGVAGVHTKTNYQVLALPPSGVVGYQAASVDDWTWGWVAGFGTEWAFGGNWSLRSEFLYVGTADRDYNIPRTVVGGGGTFVPNGTAATFTHHDNIAIARVGLNYKFGGPVVARY